MADDDEVELVRRPRRGGGLAVITREYLQESPEVRVTIAGAPDETLGLSTIEERDRDYSIDGDELEVESRIVRNIMPATTTSSLDEVGDKGKEKERVPNEKEKEEILMLKRELARVLEKVEKMEEENRKRKREEEKEREKEQDEEGVAGRPARERRIEREEPVRLPTYHGEEYVDTDDLAQWAKEDIRMLKEKLQERNKDACYFVDVEELTIFFGIKCKVMQQPARRIKVWLRRLEKLAWKLARARDANAPRSEEERNSYVDCLRDLQRARATRVARHNKKLRDWDRQLRELRDKQERQRRMRTLRAEDDQEDDIVTVFGEPVKRSTKVASRGNNYINDNEFFYISVINPGNEIVVDPVVCSGKPPTQESLRTPYSPLGKAVLTTKTTIIPVKPGSLGNSEKSNIEGRGGNPIREPMRVLTPRKRKHTPYMRDSTPNERDVRVRKWRSKNGNTTHVVPLETPVEVKRQRTCHDTEVVCL